MPGLVVYYGIMRIFIVVGVALALLLALGLRLGLLDVRRYLRIRRM